MKIHIIANFCDAFTSYFDSSIMRIAQEKGLFEPIFYNLGDFSKQAQHRVDDKPYGGGAGALLQIEPVFKCIRHIESNVQKSSKFKVQSSNKGLNPKLKIQNDGARTPPQSDDRRTEGAGGVIRKIYLGPRGKRLTQAKIEKLSEELRNGECIILCGHYEGVDHRVFELFEFEQYSIGDYVVSSGELATMVFIDAIVRLIPGVIGNSESLSEESFSEGLGRKPEYPQYTRPADFMGHKVPEELLSGDPKIIQKWRGKH